MLRIVAADDEQDMAQFYGKVLPRLGHQVAVAENGLQLLELCRSVRPHLVITDADMPVMNGLDAVEQLWREMPVPVVVVSASDPCKIRELPVGCAIHFLRKPVRMADLQRVIAHAVRA